MPKKENGHEQGSCCGCGHDHDHDHDLHDGGMEDIIELVDDDGNTINFRHVATVDFEDKWYVLFSPVEDTQDITTDEVVIFKLDTDEAGADVFAPIEDEELLNKVYERYVAFTEEDDEACGGCGDDDDEEGHGGGCSGCSGCGGK